MRLPNGYGSVVFLGKKRRKPWGARITIGWSDDNKQLYKYLGYFTDRIDAMQCLIDYNNAPYDIEARKITFEEVYKAWSARHFENVSRASALVYNSAYNKCTSLYKKPFKDIKTSHLQAIIDENKNVSSIRNVKIVCGLMYSYAIKNDIVDKDYSQYIELPKKEKKKEKKPFTEKEIKLLWQNKDKQYIDIILILLYTGMRISELLEMKTENINLNKRYMVGGIKTEAGKDRIIPIHKDIEILIKNNLDLNNKYLFVTTRGNKHLYNNVGMKINGALKSLKLSHTIHETRHTFISQCSRLKIDKILVKRIVGHSTKDITEHYTHKDADDLIQAIDDFYYF